MPKAARISDLHTCPMSTGPVPHVGGPVLPPASTSVLTEFLPAARTLDLCLCATGGPDPVAMGCPTVLIDFRLAARQDDMTAHGGRIVVGAATVEIGTRGDGVAVMPIARSSPSSGAAKSGSESAAEVAPPESLDSFCPDIASLDGLPLDQRLQKEQEIADSIEAHTPLSEDLAQLRHDRDMAVLAAAPYARSDGLAPILPPGYTNAGPSDLDMLGLSPETLGPDIRVYRRESAAGVPAYVISYRGTETGAGWRTALSDIGTDIWQGVGGRSEPYVRGMSAAETAAGAAGRGGFSVELTGHSKGGGQAAAASAASGLPATTFNAAGVHPRTLERGSVTAEELSAAEAGIRAYHNEHDPLNAAQDNRETILPILGSVAGAGAGVLGGLINPVAGKAGQVAAEQGVGFLQRDGALPMALGERIELPAGSRQGGGIMEGHSIDTMIDGMNEQVTGGLSEHCGCS